MCLWGFQGDFKTTQAKVESKKPAVTEENPPASAAINSTSFEDKELRSLDPALVWVIVILLITCLHWSSG